MKDKVKAVLTKLNDFKLLILLLAILGILFYWYELRPSSIRKTCFLKAKTYVLNEEKKAKSYGIDSPAPDFYKDRFNISYEPCLKSKGLSR